MLRFCRWRLWWDVSVFLFKQFMCKEVRAVVYRHNNGAGDTTGYESSAARRSFHDKCTSIPHGCWVLNRRRWVYNWLPYRSCLLGRLCSFVVAVIVFSVVFSNVIRIVVLSLLTLFVHIGCLHTLMCTGFHSLRYARRQLQLKRCRLRVQWRHLVVRVDHSYCRAVFSEPVWLDDSAVHLNNDIGNYDLTTTFVTLENNTHLCR